MKNAHFDGVTVVLAGDFYQILSMIPKGIKLDQNRKCLKLTHLEKHVKKLK